MYNDMCSFYDINIIQNISTVLKISVCLFMSPCPHPMTTTNLFTIPIVLPFPGCHIAGIMQYVAFSYWLISRNDMNLRLFHVFSWLGTSFLFSAE